MNEKLSNGSTQKYPPPKINLGQIFEEKCVWLLFMSPVVGGLEKRQVANSKGENDHLL